MDFYFDIDTDENESDIENDVGNEDEDKDNEKSEKSNEEDGEENNKNNDFNELLYFDEFYPRIKNNLGNRNKKTIYIEHFGEDNELQKIP